jgi:thymidylate synthase (FAD)
MAHIIVPEAEAILEKEYPVLDHGFVRLVDYMGSDARIVQAARVSYGEGTKSVRDDKALIDYLLRNDHNSPFEQVVFTFHVKMPIFVARQWVRHRTARMNEISGRYSLMKDEVYVPAEDQVHFQSDSNKQARDENRPAPPIVAEKIRATMHETTTAIFDHYKEMIDAGIAREIARINLPLSLYTEIYWQMDLHNLFHFLALRLDGHAQLEIRKYGEVIGQIVKAVCPFAWESFERHRLNGCRLSSDEILAVKNLLAGEPAGLTKRRDGEFRAKLGLEKEK